MRCKPTWFPNGLKTSCLIFTGESARFWPEFVVVTNADSPVEVKNGVYCYTADCAGGDVVFILPETLSGNYVFKKKDSSLNVVTIDAGANGNTFDGNPTRNLTSQYASYTVNNDPDEWVRQ